MSRNWIKIAAALLVAVPALVLRIGRIDPGPEIAVGVFGAAVVATAFVLAWAAEAAQVDISGSLATALLAFIAVLPEYAVDLYFAYSAGSDASRAQYAAANMTGSNRLLIGLGWPLVMLVGWLGLRRARRSGKAPERDSAEDTTIVLEPVRRIDIGFLAVASAYALVIPFTRVLAWYDAVILIGLFGLYMWRVSREAKEEPDLIGVSADLGALPRRTRRIVVPALFVAAAVIVLAAAEPFANGLIGTGARLGIDQFLLVQWLAPLASEAPELIVAGLFAWRLRASDGLGMLLSSKVNQWTLLVGSLPLAYLAGGGHGGLALDGRQTEEFILTSAQALLALAVLLDTRFTRRDATVLFALFALQFPFPSTTARLGFAALYLGIAAVLLTRRRRAVPAIVAAMRPPHRPPEPETR